LADLPGFPPIIEKSDEKIRKNLVCPGAATANTMRPNPNNGIGMGHELKPADKSAAAANGTVAQARAAIRAGTFTAHTSGIARDHEQGNLVILPQSLASDFLRFCQRNPKPCPLLAVSEPGDPMLPKLGADIDIRSDVPRYRVWRHGELVDEPTNIRALWRDD
jgi:uncharacterized protein YcsI (UPF0317 family)